MVAMTSPFPGMDPYLERHWLDVHTKLVAYAADELNRVLPESLVARTEERVAVESDYDQRREIGPDVRVFAPASSDPAIGLAGVAIDAPFKLVVALDPVIERFIKIIDEGGRLITVIEFISPSNKRGGLEEYQEKRRELLNSGVNVMEIDLTRQGNWRALMRPHVCPRQAIAEYRATIRTGPTTAYLFPMPLSHRLPDVPVPLRRDDASVKLPMQQLIEQVYRNGRYGTTLDYRQLCDPPLDEESEAWVDNLLKTAGRR
jgi:hypothetical protein